MNSPDDEDPARSESELDYAPPWARNQAARDQAGRDQAGHDQAGRDRAGRDQAALDQAGRDQAARDQFRATLRQSSGAAIEPLTLNDPENRTFGDDRPWHQRALEPELVPEPPAGVSNLWPMMLRMGLVCAIAAIVAGAVVFLFSPKPVHKVAQANASAPAIAADDDAAPRSIESAGGVPALAVEASAGASTPAAQGQVAIANPPQNPQAQAIAAPPAKSEEQAPLAAPAQQIASLPAPTVSSTNIKLAPAPGVNEPASRPGDPNQAAPAATDPKPAANPPASSAPAQAAPPAPQTAPKPAVALDGNEINTLIKRGKNLLNDGDFAAARVLFERGANAGSAEAALALGSTYDPNVIKRLGALMVKPDIESARKWYQLAADRGLAAASLQLANLPQSR